MAKKKSGPKKIKTTSVVTPAAHCSKSFSFVQCTNYSCRAQWPGGSRGRLPKCPECGSRMERQVTTVTTIVTTKKVRE